MPPAGGRTVVSKQVKDQRGLAEAADRDAPGLGWAGPCAARVASEGRQAAKEGREVYKANEALVVLGSAGDVLTLLLRPDKHGMQCSSRGTRHLQ